MGANPSKDTGKAQEKWQGVSHLKTKALISRGLSS
jgi:hypothetical protein